MRHRHAVQQGFTLLEVLIAVSILGIMLALLFGSFAICTRSWRTGDEYLRQVEQMAMLQNFFRTRLAEAWGTPDASASGRVGDDTGLRDAQQMDEWAFFQGADHYLQFVATMPESAAKRGWYLFKIFPKPNSASLYASMTPFLPFTEREMPVPEQLEIMAGVETFTLYFWGKKPEDEAPRWHREWINLPYLPELVSINIKPFNHNAWPTVVVAPRRAQPQRNPTPVNAQQ